MYQEVCDMSIIGDGKYINYIGSEVKPSWQKHERYDYCEKPLRNEESLASWIRGLLKRGGSDKAAA